MSVYSQLWDVVGFSYYYIFYCLCSITLYYIMVMSCINTFKKHMNKNKKIHLEIPLFSVYATGFDFFFFYSACVLD